MEKFYVHYGIHKLRSCNAIQKMIVECDVSAYVALMYFKVDF